MLHRFKKTKNASFDKILADKMNSNIKTYEEIEINISTFDNKIWKMTLENVSYVSNFMINVVSDIILREKDVQFYDERMQLYASDKILD